MTEAIERIRAFRLPPRYTAAAFTALAGAVILAFALIIGNQRYGPGGQFSLSQANGLCASTIGQIAQGAYASARVNCSSVASMEHLRGWATVTGVLVAAAGAALAVRAARNGQS